MQSPKLLFPWGGSKLLLLENSKKFSRLTESGPGSGSGPSGCVVHCEVPSRRTAERKSSNDQAVFINRIASLDLLESFPKIGLAGESTAIAVTSIKVQYKCVRRGKFTNIPHPVGDESQLAQSLAPSMKPEIQAPLSA